MRSTIHPHYSHSSTHPTRGHALASRPASQNFMMGGGVYGIIYIYGNIYIYIHIYISFVQPKKSYIKKTMEFNHVRALLNMHIPNVDRILRYYFGFYLYKR